MTSWREENDRKIAYFNAPKIALRDAAELQGLLAGVILDGEVNDAEIAGIERWIRGRPDISDTWPLSALRDHIREIKADGVVTQEERVQLLRFIETIVEGGRSPSPGHAAASIFDPQPNIKFRGKTFCFTGKLQMFTRSVAHEEVKARGGIPTENASFNLDFLVVGVEGNESWHAGSYGRKIEQVMTNKREDGAATRIVMESDFAAALLVPEPAPPPPPPAPEGPTKPRRGRPPLGSPPKPPVEKRPVGRPRKNPAPEAVFRAYDDGRLEQLDDDGES